MLQPMIPPPMMTMRLLSGTGMRAILRYPEACNSYRRLRSGAFCDVEPFATTGTNTVSCSFKHGGPSDCTLLAWASATLRPQLHFAGTTADLRPRERALRKQSAAGRGQPAMQSTVPYGESTAPTCDWPSQRINCPLAILDG